MREGSSGKWPSPICSACMREISRGLGFDPVNSRPGRSFGKTKNLIIDCVLDCPDPSAFPLTKRLIHLAEPVSGNRCKLLVQLCGLLIPQTEQLALGRWLRPA